MMKIEVEIYTDQRNNAVLRLPARKYPGILIQGDSLRNLAETAAVIATLSEGYGGELAEEATSLAESLSELCRWYEHAVALKGD
jgi:hypothetical protein